MKKFLFNCMTTVLAIIICGRFLSCSKDDDNGLDSQIAQEILGTWYSSDTSTNRYCTVTFYNNGTGEFFSEYHGKYGSSNSEMTGTFTWRCEGDRIITYGEYVYIDYNDGTVDTDYDPEVIYVYDGYNLIGGRYSGNASIYSRDSGGSSSGGSPSNPSPGGSYNDDLTCHVGFDNSVFPTIYQNGTYTHQIFLGFGVSKGHYSAGIGEFGIALKPSDGTITNSKKSDDVYVTNLNGYKYFSGVIFNDNAYEWGTIVFVRSKSKKVVFDYYVRYYNEKTREWKEGAYAKYTYEPKNIVNN